jgi:hypothetical protein
MYFHHVHRSKRFEHPRLIGAAKSSLRGLRNGHLVECVLEYIFSQGLSSSSWVEMASPGRSPGRVLAGSPRSSGATSASEEDKPKKASLKIKAPWSKRRGSAGSQVVGEGGVGSGSLGKSNPESMPQLPPKNKALTLESPRRSSAPDIVVELTDGGVVSPTSASRGTSLSQTNSPTTAKREVQSRTSSKSNRLTGMLKSRRSINSPSPDITPTSTRKNQATQSMGNLGGVSGGVGGGGAAGVVPGGGLTLTSSNSGGLLNMS